MATQRGTTPEEPARETCSSDRSHAPSRDRQSPNWYVISASAASFLALYTLAGPILRAFHPAYRAQSALARADWRNRVMSLAHADGETLVSDPFHGRSRRATRLLSLSIGYFIADSVVALLTPAMATAPRALVLQMLLHHGIAAYAYWESIRRNIVLYFGLTRLRMELSTVFLNLRTLLSALPGCPAWLLQANNALLLLSFVGSRLAVLPAYYAALVRHWRSFDQPAWVRGLFIVFGLLLDALNVQWLAIMVRTAVKTRAPQPPA